MSRRVVDYDQFRRERDPEIVDPPVFKIGGVEYEMAPTLPASLAIDVMAAQGSLGDDAEVPVELITQVGGSVFGDELWREILRKNKIGMEELGPVVMAILQVYAETNEEDPEDPSRAST